jgi:hypothetical protein
VRATCAYAARAARRPLTSRPGCGGAVGDVRRVASVGDGGRRAPHAAGSRLEAAGASRRPARAAAAASGHRAIVCGDLVVGVFDGTDVAFVDGG